MLPTPVVEDRNLQPAKRTRVKRKEEKAESACTLCRRDHASCDNGIPCTRCVNKGVAHLCETVFKKKGRPAKVASITNTNSPQQMQNGVVIYSPPANTSNSQRINMTPNITFTLDTPESLFASILSLPDEFLDPISLSPTEPDELQTFSTPATPQFQPQISSQSTQSNTTTTTVYFNQQTQQTATQSNESGPVCTKVVVTTIPTRVELFEDLAVDKMDIGYFYILRKLDSAKQMVPDPNTLESIGKLKLYLYSLLGDYSESQIIDYYNRKLLQLKQVYSEFGIPVILCSAFCLVYANNPALQMLGMTKDELYSKKSIFCLFWIEDTCEVLTKWADGLMHHANCNKLRVRLQTKFGYIECCANLTFHRETFTGIPLLETYFFIPL